MLIFGLVFVYILIGAFLAVVELSTGTGKRKHEGWEVTLILFVSLILGGFLLGWRLLFHWLPYGIGFVIGFLLVRIKEGYKAGLNT